LNPFPNIGGTILQLDAIRFAISQEHYSLSIYKRDVFQIQDQSAVGQLQGEQPLQLSSVFDLDPAAQSKDDLSVGGSPDSQHCSFLDVIRTAGMKAIWTPVASH
jgi:hypothetical protein